MGTSSICVRLDRKKHKTNHVKREQGPQDWLHREGSADHCHHPTPPPSSPTHCFAVINQNGHQVSRSQGRGEWVVNEMCGVVVYCQQPSSELVIVANGPFRGMECHWSDRPALRVQQAQFGFLSATGRPSSYITERTKSVRSPVFWIGNAWRISIPIAHLIPTGQCLWGKPTETKQHIVGVMWRPLCCWCNERNIQ